MLICDNAWCLVVLSLFSPLFLWFTLSAIFDTMGRYSFVMFKLKIPVSVSEPLLNPP